MGGDVFYRQKISEAKGKIRERKGFLTKAYTVQVGELYRVLAMCCGNPSGTLGIRDNNALKESTGLAIVGA